MSVCVYPAVSGLWNLDEISRCVLAWTGLFQIVSLTCEAMHTVKGKWVLTLVEHTSYACLLNPKRGLSQTFTGGFTNRPAFFFNAERSNSVAFSISSWLPWPPSFCLFVSALILCLLSVSRCQNLEQTARPANQIWVNRYSLKIQVAVHLALSQWRFCAYSTRGCINLWSAGRTARASLTL